MVITKQTEKKCMKKCVNGEREETEEEVTFAYFSQLVQEDTEKMVMSNKQKGKKCWLTA